MISRANVIPRLHDTAGCQTGCTTDRLNEQWQFVQPVVKPVVKRVECLYTRNNRSTWTDLDKTYCQESKQSNVLEFPTSPNVISTTALFYIAYTCILQISINKIYECLSFIYILCIARIRGDILWGTLYWCFTSSFMYMYVYVLYFITVLCCPLA